ncbi:MAG TPA: hypothetical protein VJQ79_10560 [Acidimicrobiia bacterium]|nr:hypothetical protein [Acidimicrobiia bacterium]
MNVRRMVAAGALLALALTACNAADSDDGTDGTGDGGGRLASVSIEEVLTFEGETPAFVRGTLFADANGVKLCEAIGESFPVQCLGAQISITDLDLFPEYAGLLVGDGEVRTSDGEVSVVGYYSDGTLRIDPEAAAADAS